MKYTIQKRKNMHGKECIATFIGDWNVWDIPVNEYTSAVEKAIKRAYEIGLKHMRAEVEIAASDLCDKLRIED